jgi:gliding motility-associated-like protein
LVLKRVIFAISLMVLINITGHGQDLDPVCAGSIQRYGVSASPNSVFSWAVEGGTIIDGDGTDTVTIQWPWTLGRYSLEVNVSVNGNDQCVANTRTWQSLKKPAVDLGPDQAICQGDSLQLDAGTGYDAPYQLLWNNDPAYTGRYFYTGQAGVVTLSVTDSGRCTNTDSLVVTVNPLPIVEIGITDTVLCDNSQSFYLNALDITYGNDGVSAAAWTINRVESNGMTYMVTPATQKIDTLSVKITNNNLCSSSDTMFILTCDITPIFTDMTNTIIPDGSAENKVWTIPHIEFFPNAVLEIFDQWGRLVFHTEHVATEKWDGQSKGRPLPMDSYYYVLDLKYGGSKPITGTVNLIR